VKKVKIITILILSVITSIVFSQDPVTALIKFPVEFELKNSTLGGFYESYNSVPASTDIDGDGRVDLLIGKDNGTIVRYEQDSLYSDTYNLRTSNFNSINVVYESAPAICDLDGDNRLDLLIGDGDGYINHYEQSSVNSATFTYRTDQLDGMRPGPMAKPCVYDIDNDGKLDLLIGVDAGTIVHYEQDAVNSLTFVQHTLFLLPVGYRRASPSIDDIDYDGLLDLLIGDEDGNVAHYIQDSLYANSFTLSDANYMSIDVGDYATTDFADLDGDCLLDLLIGENFGNINYYEQTVADSIKFENTYTGEVSSVQQYIVKSSDLEDDLIISCDCPEFRISLSETSGYQDSLVISPSAGDVTQTVYVRYEPVEPGTCSDAIIHSSQNMTEKVIQLTGNGIAVPKTWLYNTPQFELLTEDMLGNSNNTYCVPAVTDFDGDGLLDVLTTRFAGMLSHYEQNSANSANFTEVTNYFNSISSLGNNAAPCFTDIDNDGLIDLLIGKNTGSINHYEQDTVNSTSFSLVTDNFNSISVAGGTAAPTVTDFDGDGLYDLIIGCWFGNIQHYEQDAVNSTSFSLVTTNFNSINVGNRPVCEFLDLDGDGLLDMIAGELNGNINHYEQVSLNSTVFDLITENFSSIDVGEYCAPCFTDIDGDGDLDILIGEEDGNLNRYEQDFCTELNFGNVYLNTSVINSYYLNASNLIDDLYVSSPAGFEISLTENSGFGQNITLSPVNGSVTDTVYVKFIPSQLQVYSGNITHTSTDMQTADIAVSGTGIFEPVAALIKLPVEYDQKSTEFNSINTGSDSAPAIIDIDRDGLLDLIVGNADGYLLHWEQDSINSDTFSRNYSSLDSTHTSTLTKPCFTDIDGDGLIDLLVGKSGGWIARYEQASIYSDEFTEVSQNFSGLDIGNNCAPVVSDIDGDGLLDLIAGKANGTISHFTQDAPDSWNFTLQTTSFNSIDIGDNAVPTLSDLDNNGLTDLVIGKTGGYIAHYEQHEENSLVFDHIADRLVPEDLGAEATPVFCDFDNDGLLDMLSGHAGGNIYHYEQVAENGFDFGSLNINRVSIPQKYLVNYRDLNSDLTITPPAGFTVSIEENGTYGSALVILYTVAKGDTVFVRFEPEQALGYNSNIVHTASDMTDVMLPVTGTGILGVPQNITIVISGTELILSWDAVQEASGYKVYSSDDPYSGFVEEALAPTGETWSIEASESKKFYYVVAVDDSKVTVKKTNIKASSGR
jgi:uncharacterized protein (DUF2141 family)